MNKFLYSVCMLVFTTSIIAQNSFNCSSHDVYQQLYNNNAQFRTNQEQLERETQNYLSTMQAAKSATATYIIPIVFHIIHTGGSGNISNAQILDQVAILNKEFKRKQADTVLTPAAFKPLAAGLDVEFRLATIDPNGNCTNGINRIYNSLATCSFGWDDVKSLSYWPSTRYLNVWLIESMHYPGSTTCNGGGYSTFPGGQVQLDGIVIRGDLIGSIGTAATNSGWGNFKGRYLVHELGHWFNLRHIWGDATCGNDFVNDTPPAVNSNGGCPTFPHNPNNSCGSGPDGEMFTNYMDYTNGPCLNMFSIGQVARMTACITSAVSGRNNLWSASNLSLTGTADPYVYPSTPCAANPVILPFGKIVACEGDSVQFTDYSSGGTVTSRQWNFFGQPASSLTDSIVKVKYAAAGTYDVALTTNAGSTTKTQTFVNIVQILPATTNTNYVYPFTDSFENTTAFNNDWVIVNKDEQFDPLTWEVFNSTSYTGINCIGIHNAGNLAPRTDELISPLYDLTTAVTATLSFRLHYSQNASTDYDKLIVYMTNTCSNAWSPIYNKNATALKTISAMPGGDYFPAAGSNEWRKENIDLSIYLPFNQARFKFAFTSGGGNNIFIDDLNIAGDVVGLKENKFTNTSLNLSPNPCSDKLIIDIDHAEKINEIEVLDLLGRVYPVKREEFAGSLTVNTTSLVNGVYLLRVKQNNGTATTAKFIKQTKD